MGTTAATVSETHQRAAGVATPNSSRPRLTCLDITKGVLVLAMVVYHSLNYSSQYHLGFRYLSFLPPSFILIAGFLVSFVYSTRQAAGNGRITGRLLTRGAKLLVLFTTLNIGAQFVRSPSYGHSVGISNFFTLWDEVYFFGGGRVAVFEVLLPIAYLLILAPILIWMDRLHRTVLPILALIAIGCCAALEQFGKSSPNFNLIAAGMLGMLAGRSITDPIRLGEHATMLVALYCICYPVEVTYGYHYAVQLISACLALLAICALSARIGQKSWSQQRLIHLGRHSLFAYITQIGILQTVSRFTGRPELLSTEWISLFVLTFLLTVSLVEAVEWLRTRFKWAARTYSAVFA